jgi:NodT family efflux transporter outer membrane factor (OMF) lipoprotein
MDDVPPFSVSGSAVSSDRWWTVFEDDELDARVQAALEGNFSLAAAWERLRESRAIVRRQRADLFPLLDGIAGAEAAEGSGADSETSVFLGLEASYEVDLWGRVESEVEAERLRASATAEDYQAAAISLSAEVALAWYELTTARLQLELLASQVETNEKVLEAIESRFATGQSGSADVLRQRQLVESTREQLIVFRSAISVLEHRLAVLEGRPAQSVAVVSEAKLPSIPEMPRIGLPSELLLRRPDVRSSMLRLRAADSDVAVAVSEQYPRINLAASLRTTDENGSDLIRDWVASLSGQLVAPLLDGERRRAEVERTEAVRRQLLAEYGQSVVVAFQEVEDALAQEAQQIDRIDSLETQLELAKKTYEQLRSQYLNGAADFIDVLIALREQQAIERSLLTANLDRLSFRIALYRSLAGGFETSREESIVERPEEDALQGDGTDG